MRKPAKVHRLDASAEKVLAVLTAMTERNGTPPSLQAIAFEQGAKSRSRIHVQMRKLQAFGLVEKRSNQWWPARVVIVKLTERQGAFVMRRAARCGVTAERVLQGMVNEEMTTEARSLIVRANLQEEPHARRQAEEGAESAFWKRAF